MNSRVQTAVWIVSVALGVFALIEARPQNTAQRRRLVPQDEGRKAPGFGPVIERFKSAVRARDTATIVAMLGDRAASSVGSDDVGPSAFRKHHRLDDRSSEFWTIAENLLRNGSTFSGDCSIPDGCYVTYPFWSDGFPDQDLDSFYHMVVRRENVPMYATPRADAPVIERLSYEIVRRVIDQSKPLDEAWTQIALLDGRTGAVRTSDLYNPTFGYRMTFVRSANGTWVLGAFLAGD